MITTLIILGLFYLLSLYFYFKKIRISNISNYLTFIHFISFGLLIFSVGLMWFDLKLSGRFTKTVFALTYLISSILIFGLTQNKIKRIYTGIIALIPVILPTSLLFTKSAVIPIVIVVSLFNSYEYTEKIDGKYSIEIQNGGVLSCGQKLYLTEKKGFFIKKEYLDYENQCLPIADSLKIDLLNNDSIIVNIFHRDTEQSNPMMIKMNLEKLINVP
jgi:hypothetical protein